MRLLIIGSLEGHITQASQIAIARGAKVTQVDDIERGLNLIRSGHGAELVMVDIALDIAVLVGSLASERINVPVVACGLHNDAEAAVAAIKAGAKEYIPLPPIPISSPPYLRPWSRKATKSSSAIPQRPMSSSSQRKSRRRKPRSSFLVNPAPVKS